ncbi:MAG: glycosyltransferase [Methanolobus sp.]
MRIFSYCQNLASDLNVAHACHFLGYSPDEVLKDWTNACNMTCVPSRNEPFGIVVLELRGCKYSSGCNRCSKNRR